MSVRTGGAIAVLGLFTGTATWYWFPESLEREGQSMNVEAARISDSAETPIEQTPGPASGEHDETSLRVVEAPKDVARKPKLIQEEEWSTLEATERIAIPRREFDAALAERPANLDAAAHALSVLRTELYPDRRAEYAELEERFDVHE